MTVLISVYLIEGQDKYKRLMHCSFDVANMIMGTQILKRACGVGCFNYNMKAHLISSIAIRPSQHIQFPLADAGQGDGCTRIKLTSSFLVRTRGASF